MSQNIFNVSNKRNRVVRYRKPSPTRVKSKSGILERYTYKTDTGKFLPVASAIITKLQTLNPQYETGETIRTDCDSTTDDFEPKSKNAEHLSDSDSDCQIVKVQKGKKVHTNQVYMIYSGSELAKSGTRDEVLVISDSDDEKPGRNVQINQLTSSQSRKIDRAGDVENMGESHELSTDEESLEPTVYEISDNIRITLPKCSKKSDNLNVDVPHKPKIEIISDVVVKTVGLIENCSVDSTTLSPLLSDMNPPQMIPWKLKTTPILDTPLRSPQKSHILESIPSKKEKLLSNLKIDENFNGEHISSLKIRKTSPRTSRDDPESSPSKYPKADLSLSPETMKSEFYSYLKINTNPNAQKIENTVQNRRSIRVRNLYKEAIKVIEKTKVQFPLPQKKFEVEDLDTFMKNYLKKEKLIEKVKKNPKSLEPMKKPKKFKKLIIKRNLATIRKLKLARILRSNRITRHSLLRISKSYKKKRSKKQTVQKIEFSETKTDTTEDKPLNQLDKFDLLAQNYMVQNVDYYNESPIASPQSFYQEMYDGDVFDHNYTKKFVPETIRPESRGSLDSEFLGFHSDFLESKGLKLLQDEISNLDKGLFICDSFVKRIEEEERKKWISQLDLSNVEKELEVTESSLDSRTELDSDSLTESPTRTDMDSETDRRSQIESGEEFNPKIDTWTEFSVQTPPTSHLTPYPTDDSEKLLQNSTVEERSFIQLDQKAQVKPFHRSLLSSGKTGSIDPFQGPESKDSGDVRKKTHQVSIDHQDGPVLCTYYVDGTLIVVQEFQIGFWKQTPLGNVLGSSNMWYTIGKTKRYVFEKACVCRRASDMVSSADGSVAYIEVWTKEHSSEFRQLPVTDIFVTVYHHKGYGALDKKVVQLENIKGYGKNVRYCVMRYSREVVVGWRDQLEPDRTHVRAFELALDFQTITSIRQFEDVYEELTTMHIITNCDTLVIGSTKTNLFVWNVQYGWLVKTIDFNTENSSPTGQNIQHLCLRATCETGYLFLVQQVKKRIIRLVGINGVNGQWKQLQIFRIPRKYNTLIGTSTESGVLMLSYPNGFLCFDMQNGELLADTEFAPNRVLPADKFLVYLTENNISVKHVMVHILEHGSSQDEYVSGSFVKSFTVERNEVCEQNSSAVSENIKIDKDDKSSETQQDRFETFVRNLLRERTQQN